MVQQAGDRDWKPILSVYRAARAYMAENGNPRQWGEGYPPEELLKEDMRLGRLFVCAEGEEIHGVFAFIVGEDPTYRHIEGGAWKNDRPYGTIHRIASDGAAAGIFRQCLDFCKGQMDDLRIDTHQDNRAMRHLVEKHGFERCGIIYVGDGTPRIAYQLTKSGRG